MLCTLLTDFGESDGYVAAMKGVISSRAPGVSMIDLSHQIPPQNVRAGSHFWATALDYFPEGTVHIGVVDPGVGTSRAVCVATNGRQVLVCPDNGLLSHWWFQQEAPRAFRVRASDWWLPVVSNTFHGRDIFAPTGAALAAGRVKPEELGEPFEPELLTKESYSVQASGGEGVVIHIDHFGNVMTSLPGGELPKFRDVLVAGLGSIPRVSTYGEAREGELVLLEGSTGFMELAVVGGSAAARIELAVGDPVKLSWA